MAPFYNESAKRADPSETHLYSVAISGVPESANCITCGIKNLEGDKLCRQNSADLSSNFKSFIHQCSGPGVPEVHIRSLVSVFYRIVNCTEGYINIWLLCRTLKKFASLGWTIMSLKRSCRASDYQLFKTMMFLYQVDSPRKLVFGSHRTMRRAKNIHCSLMCKFALELEFVIETLFMSEYPLVILS